VYSGATIGLGDTDIARSQGRRIDAGEYAGERAVGETNSVGGMAEPESARGRTHIGAIRSGENARLCNASGKDSGRTFSETGNIINSGATVWLGIPMHAERRPFDGPGQNEFDGHDAGRAQAHGVVGASGEVCRLGESSSREWGSRRIAEAGDGENATERSQYRDNTGASGSDVGICGFYDRFDIVHCTDGKARRIEPGSFPLAYGIPARVGRLRGYGNSIVPQVAAAFVKAFREC
jgi:DNA (cytosine-5)-methyltransferase 1